MWLLTPACLILVLSYLGSARAFSFALQTGSDGKISRCGRVNVIWQGGTPPFNMVVMPAFDYPTNITMPDSAWSASDQRGNFSWTVNSLILRPFKYEAGRYDVRFVWRGLWRSITAVHCGRLFIELSATLDSYRLPILPKFHQCQRESMPALLVTLADVQQCSPLQVYWDASAVAPVRLLGLIPSGQPFMFTAAPGSTSWTWNTNVAAGTSFILGAFNAGKTGTGGSGGLMTVGPGSAGCLDDSSPSSTPAATVPTQTTSGRTGTKTGVGNGTNVAGGGVKTVTAIATVLPDGRTSLSTGAIVGIVISAVVALLTLQAALFWFCCRRQVSDLLSHRKDMRTKGIKSGEVDLASQHGDAQSAVYEGEGRRSIFGRTNRQPSRNGASTDIYESTISPFHDDRRTSRPDLLGSRDDRVLSAYTAYDAESTLAPPRPHGRTDSMGSGLTLDLPMSTFDSFNYSPTEAPLLPPPSATRSNSDQSSPASPAVPSSTPSPRPPTKAQLATSMSLHNGDTDRTSRSYRFGGIMPSQSTPAGGLRRHEDAGRAASDVEDLPPLYKPEWHAEGQRRNS